MPHVRKCESESQITGGVSSVSTAGAFYDRAIWEATYTATASHSGFWGTCYTTAYRPTRYIEA